MSKALYHERQHLSLCALHSLNNLFQEHLFTKVMLDELCERLTPKRWFNPHRSIIGIGNYDVNVIMSALETHGFSMVWFDKRKSILEIDLSTAFGFIINCRSSLNIGPFSLPSPQNHWFCAKQIDKAYYNLDSKLSSPELIGSSEEFLQFLGDWTRKPEVSLFLVLKNISNGPNL